MAVRRYRGPQREDTRRSWSSCSRSAPRSRPRMMTDVRRCIVPLRKATKRLGFRWRRRREQLYSCCAVAIIFSNTNNSPFKDESASNTTCYCHFSILIRLQIKGLGDVTFKIWHGDVLAFSTWFSSIGEESLPFTHGHSLLLDRAYFCVMCQLLPINNSTDVLN